MGGERFQLNQKAWFVARENFKNHTVEYLDDQHDVFYIKGVKGYATKTEAHERVDRYKGDTRGLFIVGPKYGRYNITDQRPDARHRQNTHLLRFEIMDRMIEREGASAEVVEELRGLLKNFALTNGILCFSNLQKTKDFLNLLKKYNVLTKDELRKALYDF